MMYIIKWILMNLPLDCGKLSKKLNSADYPTYYFVHKWIRALKWCWMRGLQVKDDTINYTSYTVLSISFPPFYLSLYLSHHSIYLYRLQRMTEKARKLLQYCILMYISQEITQDKIFHSVMEQLSIQRIYIHSMLNMQQRIPAHIT